jgi:hypothetical protein
VDCRDCAIGWCGELVLHLHGLEYDQHLTIRDSIAGGNAHLGDRAGEGRYYDGRAATRAVRSMRGMRGPHHSQTAGLGMSGEAQLTWAVPRYGELVPAGDDAIAGDVVPMFDSVDLDNTPFFSHFDERDLPLDRPVVEPKRTR